MAIGLLLIALLGLFSLSFNKDNIRLSFVKTVVFFSLIVLGLTEILSLFNLLNHSSLVIGWSLINFFLIYFIIKKRLLFQLTSLRIKLIETLFSFSNLEKFLVGFSLFIIVGIFLQGIIYPTNNWDSMAYHMPRIVHWIQNESLAHYRTTIYPQLNSPPFAEYLILNINLLFGNDYLSNSVQLFFLVGTGVAISMVAKQLGLNRFGQILSVFILICIPEVILLSSSTHTEIVVSFFMVSAIYFLIRITEKKSLINFLFLGCCLGLAVATKITAFIYIAPFLLIWGIHQLYLIVFKKEKLRWLHYLLLLLSFVVINLGHYSRNYQLTDNVFATNSDIHNYYVNEEHSAKMMVSNILRNISSQFGFPKIAPIVNQATRELHGIINVNPDDRKTTTHDYRVDPLATHENNGSNIYHAILMFLSLLWMLVYIKKQNLRLTIYWIAIILSFLLFCFYLKWQPWAKLHAPFFIFYSVVLAHFLIKIGKSKILFNVMILGFVTYATSILLFNWSRPLITYPPFTSKIKITDDRYKKYFSRFLRYHDDYKIVSEQIASDNLKNIGLLFGNYDMEYQLFLNPYRDDIKSFNINPHEICSKIPVQADIDCIVSTEFEHVVTYKGEKYYNVTKKNDGYLYLFLKK